MLGTAHAASRRLKAGPKVSINILTFQSLYILEGILSATPIPCQLLGVTVHVPSEPRPSGGLGFWILTSVDSSHFQQDRTLMVLKISCRILLFQSLYIVEGICFFLAEACRQDDRAKKPVELDTPFEVRDAAFPCPTLWAYANISF